MLLFFAPVLLGGGQFLYRDAGRAYYPEKRYLAEELRAGRFPEWNPHVGLGAPIVAGAIASAQHPANLLFLALPFDAAFRLWVVLCTLAGGLGALAWARTLGAGPAASALAGLAFALSGFLVSSSDNLIHLATMAAAPWLLAAARSHAARGGPLRLAGVLAASFACASGGELLDWAVALALAAAQAWLPGIEPPAPRRLARSVAAAAAAILGAAPVLLPFAAFLPASSRGVALPLDQAARWNLHPARLLEFAVPHLARGPLGSIRNEVYVALTGDRVGTPWTLSLYAGAATIALAALAAKRNAAARVLVALAAFGAWCAMGHHAGFGAVAARLPVLSSVRYFERLAGWPTLLLAVAAALGAERLVRERPAARRAAAGAALAAAALLASSVAAPAMGPRLAGAAASVGEALASNLAEGTRAAGLALALLAGIAFGVARGRLVRAAPLLLALVVALDLAGANVRAYVTSDPALLYPAGAPLPSRLAAAPELGRVTAPFALDRERWPELLPYESSWRWGARTAAASFHLAWRVSSFDAYAGVFPARLARFWARVPLAGQTVPAGLVGVGAVSIPHRLERAAEVRLRPPWRVLAEDPELPAWLVEVPHRPRVYLAGAIVPVDEDGALEFLARADPAREAPTALEGGVPAGYTPPRGTARLGVDAAERVTVLVESDGPALLVLNDQVLDGWRATVDGRPARIHAANFLARGVWVEAGRHEVVFRYRTPLWREGWIAFALAAAVLAGWGRLRRRPGRPHPASASDARGDAPPSTR